MSSERNFHTDEPITELKEDILGRGQFSKNLAQAICRYKGQESLVLGLYGHWGSGKTSIINMMIQEVLDQEDDILIIEFKPWYFSGQDQLLEQFFKHLSSEIISKIDKFEKTAKKSIEKIGEHLSRLSSVLKPVKYVSPFIGISSELVDEMLSKSKVVADALSGLKTEQKFDVIAQKKELDKELKNLNKKILIIIDDIDRLTKEEMRQIFQLVKGLANFPNTIYLLSFDPQVVTEALQDVQTGDGAKYLEKIVQVGFSVPEVSRLKLEKYFIEKVYTILPHDSKIDKNLDQDFISKDENDQFIINSSYWEEIVYSGNFLSYFDNLREINRFLNVFRFDYDFIVNEVNTIDLVVLSAIKSQDNKLYNFIRDNKDLFSPNSDMRDKIRNPNLIGRDDNNNQEQVDSLKQIYLDNQETFQKNHIVESILKIIFPTFRLLLQPNHRQWGHESTLEKQRRITSREIFDIFFQLSILDDKIPYEEIKSIIAVQDKPEEFAEKIKEFMSEEKKFQELFSELNLHQEEFEENNKNELLKVLLPIGDFIDSYKMRVTYYSEKFSSFFITLLKNSSIDLMSFLQDLQNKNIEGIYLLCELLHSYSIKHGFYDENRNFIGDEIDKSEHGETFKQLEQLIDIRLQNKADNDSLINEHNFSYYLYTWRRINQEAAKKYVHKLLGTTQGIINYLTGGLSYSFTYSSMDKETKPKFEPQYITYFIEVEDLRNQVQKIKDNQFFFNKLPDKSQIAVSTFLEQFSENKRTSSLND